MNQPKITSAGNEELPFQFKNNYPDDKEWTAGVRLLNEWTPADTQLRHIVQFIRSAEFRPAHFYVELLEQYVTASNQQLLRELKVQAVIFSHVTHDFGTELEVGEEQAVPLSVIEAKLKEYGEK